jgi:hypothetical protein
MPSKTEKDYKFTRNQILNIVDAAQGKKGSCKYAKQFIKILKKEEQIERSENNKR